MEKAKYVTLMGIIMKAGFIVIIFMGSGSIITIIVKKKIGDSMRALGLWIEDMDTANNCFLEGFYIQDNSIRTSKKVLDTYNGLVAHTMKANSRMMKSME